MSILAPSACCRAGTPRFANRSLTGTVQFYDDNCQPLGPGAKKAALRFSPNYVVEYRWDEAAGGYARFVNGKPPNKTNTVGSNW